MISDEAFRAANAAYMETLTDLRLSEGGGLKMASRNRRALRAALEAAAPHMLAQAFDEGKRAADLEWQQSYDLVTPDEHRFIATNPYRSQA